MDTKCALCGKDPAEGWAAIEGKRYCHGDEAYLRDLLAADRENRDLESVSHRATCYELAQWGDVEPASAHLRGI